MDISRRLGVRTGLEGVLLVIKDADVEAEFLPEAALKSIQRSVSGRFKGLRDSVIGVVDTDAGIKRGLHIVGKIHDLELAEMQRLVLVQILTAESFHDLLRRDLADLL